MYPGGAGARLRPMLLRALTIALAGLALGAPSALAATEWSLVFEGTGTIDVDDDWAGTESFRTWKEHADFSWRSEMTGIVYDDNGILVQEGAGETTAAGRASLVTTFTKDGKTQTVTNCPLGGAVRQIDETTIPAVESYGTALVVRPFDLLIIDVPCTTSNWKYGLFWPRSSGGPTLEHEFAAYVDMPREAQKLGKVIQVVKSDPERANARCVATEETCSMQWEGTVTLTRKEYAPPAPDPDDGVAPLPPPLPEAPAPAPAPEPAPAPAPGDDDLLFPLVPAVSATKATVTASSASATVTCASACSGTVKVFAAGAKPLATRRFQAPAGKATRVTVKLSRAARRAVKRAGGVKLVVATKPAGAPAITRTVRARLR